jgi:signal transduction histidine kinase
LQYAISASPKGASISLRLEDHDPEVHLIIQDHGVGMSEEKLANFFNPFARSEDSETTDTLGLDLDRKHHRPGHNGQHRPAHHTRKRGHSCPAPP